jgi:EAL domain-containing protein (putative c-di-GMP-specific phosphodiesterase class I)
MDRCDFGPYRKILLFPTDRTRMYDFRDVLGETSDRRPLVGRRPRLPNVPEPKNNDAHGSQASRREIDSVPIVLQPIVDIATGVVVAAEALARFPTAGAVEETFAIAYAAGRGVDLEAACLRAALLRRPEMPAGVLLTVNVSPDALSDPKIQRLLCGDLSGLVVEVTEHAAKDQGALARALDGIRGRGALIAVDDASTGYAGLLRLTALRPDIVKLDRRLVAGARERVDQAAVIDSLVTLSRRIGAAVLGEGVETLDDLVTLASLDVDYAQGWAIARPAEHLPPIAEDAVRACQQARAAVMALQLPDPSSAATLRAMTAALAGSSRPADLHAALTATSHGMNVDEIALSTLTPDGLLTEVSGTGPHDAHSYALSDFPATKHTLATGTMTEAHTSDASTDPAERDLLIRDRMASVLITPLGTPDNPLGVLEFRHRTHRRWTKHDLDLARTLAEHITSALRRMHDAEWQAALTDD